MGFTFRGTSGTWTFSVALLKIQFSITLKLGKIITSSIVKVCCSLFNKTENKNLIVFETKSYVAFKGKLI